MILALAFRSKIKYKINRTTVANKFILTLYCCECKKFPRYNWLGEVDFPMIVLILFGGSPMSSIVNNIHLQINNGDDGLIMVLSSENLLLVFPMPCFLLALTSCYLLIVGEII